jgi:hypothetical protein
MTRSLTTLLAIPAVLLAGVAQGSITWLNIPPVDAYYEVGTEFVLEWEPQTRTDTFALTLSSYLTNPIYIGPGSGPFPVPITDSKNIDLFTHGEFLLSYYSIYMCSHVQKR